MFTNQYLDSGDKKSGASVQLFNAQYDEGLILTQEEIILEPDGITESLRKKVESLEGALYLRVIKELELDNSYER